MYHACNHCDRSFLLLRKAGVDAFTAYFMSVRSNQSSVCRHLDIDSDLMQLLLWVAGENDNVNRIAHKA